MNVCRRRHMDDVSAAGDTETIYVTDAPTRNNRPERNKTRLFMLEWKATTRLLAKNPNDYAVGEHFSDPCDK